MSHGGIFRRGAAVGHDRLGCVCSWAIAGGLLMLAALPARAVTPEPVPAELNATIERLEAAANERDLEAVMEFYDADFEHDDGLDHRELRTAIADFWEGYASLTYDIELRTWEATDTGYIIETDTTIVGEMLGDRAYALESVVRSRQTWVNDQMVQQTTLEEASTLSSGSNPPTVRVQLPNSVAPGDRFDFDAIVLEPLDDTFLLGGALEESVAQRDDTFIELEPLTAGGLFKTGTAPEDTGDLWISGAIIRKDGITIVTQRLTITAE